MKTVGKLFKLYFHFQDFHIGTKSIHVWTTTLWFFIVISLLCCFFIFNLPSCFFNLISFIFVYYIFYFLVSNAVSCFECSSQNEAYCPEMMSRDDEGIIPYNSCSHIHEGNFCVKAVGIIGGTIYLYATKTPQMFAHRFFFCFFFIASCGESCKKILLDFFNRSHSWCLLV